jgi:ribosome maturation factor RimP
VPQWWLGTRGHIACDPVWAYNATFADKLNGRIYSSPFFMADRFLRPGGGGAPTGRGTQQGRQKVLGTTHWYTSIERTVTGLDYELVDVERSAAGLLRVYIDRVPGRSYPAGESESVTVDDCERVTRQLQYVLEVEGVSYARLEVSSPGLDRALKRAADYERFAGQEISLTLKLPFQGRKNFRGQLLPVADGWRLVLAGDKAEQALDFKLDEVREARLVPVIDFKGRAGSRGGAQQAADTDRGVNGGQTR